MMRAYGQYHGQRSGGRACSLIALLGVTVGLVALGTVGYTVSSLRSLRSGSSEEAISNELEMGSDAAGGTKAAANGAGVAQVLRRLEERVERLFTTASSTQANSQQGDSSSADTLAAINRLNEKLQALSSEVKELPARLKAEVGSPKQAAAAPAAAPSTSTSKKSGGSKNVVLGMAKNIELPNLYRFVRSLRTHGGDSVDIVIFTDDYGADLAWVYEAYGVQVQKFSIGQFSDKVQKFHPSSYRWMLIRDWMKAQSPGAYDNVLFIDVRDSVFQRDPFAEIEGKPGFYAFLEAKPKTIAECGWNAGWVRDCFGDQALAAVGDRVITCSGTSMGSWEDALKYAVMVGDEIERNPCERNGVDQGMHNYFVYGGQLEKAVSQLHLVTNEEGWIATVQSMPSLHRDWAGRVLNEKKEVVAVVHQYDRSDALKEQYAREYVWLDQGELNRR